MSAVDLIKKEIAAMPPVLRALLEAELAAGNEVVEVGHSFPAAPAGAYLRLAKPLLSHPQKSGDGFVYYDRNDSNYSGEITDAKRHFFLLEPPHPPEPEPDMNAIRAALGTRRPIAPEVQMATSTPARSLPSSTVSVPSAATKSEPQSEASQTLVQRFQASMVLDYEKWHDGTGYDLKLLREMSPDERNDIHDLLIERGTQDWRDVEALACFDTPEAHAALEAALKSSNPEVRNAVTRAVPERISDEARTASLVQGLKTAVIYGGLTQALDQVVEFHPPEIVDALMRGALDRAGDVAVHFAAMLYYIHGKAAEPFDWEQRPFFLRFNTDDRRERETVFRELCEAIQVDPRRFLSKAATKNAK
jgi:hypothetical protein